MRNPNFFDQFKLIAGLKRRNGRMNWHQLVGFNWQLLYKKLVIGFSILALLSLLLAANSHLHSTIQETQDCSICYVVSHQSGGDILLPALAAALFFLLTLLCNATFYTNVFATPVSLPPSCGPPAF